MGSWSFGAFGAWRLGLGVWDYGSRLELFSVWSVVCLWIWGSDWVAGLDTGSGFRFWAVRRLRLRRCWQVCCRGGVRSVGLEWSIGVLAL